LNRRLTAALLLLLAWGGSLSLAQSPVSVRAAGLDSRTVTFVMGNVQFVLLHELAHLLIGEFEVPVFGPEETAADYIAATVLLQDRVNDRAGGQRALDYLLAAADAFVISWQEVQARGLVMRYWDAHALNIQRFYQVACLIYGSDPEKFSDLPDRTGLPRDRARNCPAEYRRADRSVRWLLQTYGRGPADPPGQPVKVVYDKPRTVVAVQLTEEIRGLRMLENAADRMTRVFALPRKVTILMRNCGQSESAWVSERQELVICYELLDTFYRLSDAQ